MTHQPLLACLLPHKRQPVTDCLHGLQDQDYVRPSIHEATPKPLMRLRHDYHVRILVPCYKEDTSILQRTCACALACQMPPGCSRTVYLCDDGKSPEKRKWCVYRIGPASDLVTLCLRAASQYLAPGT